MRRHSSSDATSRGNSLTTNPSRVSAPHTRNTSITNHDIDEDCFFQVNNFLVEDADGRGVAELVLDGGDAEGDSISDNLTGLLHVSPNKIQQQSKNQAGKKGEMNFLNLTLFETFIMKLTV